MTTIIEANLIQENWVADSFAKYTNESVNKAICRLVRDRKDLSIKKFDDDHFAIISNHKMTVFFTKESPWSSYIDKNCFWTEKQKQSFHKLCKELEVSENYDPSSYYEL